MKTRVLSEAEYEAMLGAFRGRMAQRNRTLFLLQTAAGFRISEMLSLKLRDVVTRDGMVTESISVARRNMKQFHYGQASGRTVPIGPTARRALAEWIKRLLELGYALPDDPVFPAMTAREKRAASRQAIWMCYKRAARAAGVQTRGVGTHSARKTFGTRLHVYFCTAFKNGAVKEDPLRLTAKAMGHKNINTTDQYLNFDGAIVDRAILTVAEKKGG